jgi:hypothetical protein
MLLSTTSVVSKVLHKVSKITNAEEDIYNNIRSASVVETATLPANVCVRSYLLTELVITSVEHVRIK